MVFICINSCRIKLILVHGNSCIAVQRQPRSLLHQLEPRHQGTGIACWQDGRNRLACKRQNIALSICAQCLPIRQIHEICTFRQGNQILRCKRPDFISKAAYGTNAGSIKDFPVFICIKGSNLILPFLMVLSLLRHLPPPFQHCLWRPCPQLTLPSFSLPFSDCTCSWPYPGLPLPSTPLPATDIL